MVEEVLYHLSLYSSVLTKKHHRACPSQTLDYARFTKPQFGPVARTENQTDRKKTSPCPAPKGQSGPCCSGFSGRRPQTRPNHRKRAPSFRLRLWRGRRPPGSLAFRGLGNRVRWVMPGHSQPPLPPFVEMGLEFPLRRKLHESWHPRTLLLELT